jgi:hypothetical protein
MGFYILLIPRRITNTWTMMRQSFAVVSSYRPLILLPVISAIFCLLTSIIVLGGGILVFDIPIRGEEFAPTTPGVTADGAHQALVNALYRVLVTTTISRSGVRRPTTSGARRNTSG